MFLSSLTLSISNPGFTFGCEPNKDMQCMTSVCLTLMDLSIFYLHPIILRWRISVLTKEQEGIDKSKNLALSQKYEKNAEILDLLNEEFFALSLLLYFYGTSPTRTSHALLSLFNKESANDQLSQNETCFGVNLSSDSKIGIEVNVLKCLPTTVAIILNFSLSFISFTR